MSEEAAHSAKRRVLKEWMTQSLSREERLVLLLYYYEGMTMNEIGLTFGVSESSVARMHSSLLQRARALLRRRGLG